MPILFIFPFNLQEKTMSKKIKAVLTVEVTYEDESETMSLNEMMTEARANLKDIADRAASNGQMSGDTPMIVDFWKAEVIVNPV
jgi:hypothetical protein